MKRIEWTLKMMLGLLCYWPVLWLPLTRHPLHLRKRTASVTP